MTEFLVLSALFLGVAIGFWRGFDHGKVKGFRDGYEDGYSWGRAIGFRAGNNQKPKRDGKGRFTK